MKKIVILTLIVLVSSCSSKLRTEPIKPRYQKPYYYPFLEYPKAIQQKKSSQNYCFIIPTKLSNGLLNHKKLENKF